MEDAPVSRWWLFEYNKQPLAMHGACGEEMKRRDFAAPR
jgi:hypothetical protein